MTPTYTLSELMVCAAAREIRDGELVFVGMRLPLIAFCRCQENSRAQSIGIFENGVIRNSPASQLIYTMADPPNILWRHADSGYVECDGAVAIGTGESRLPRRCEVDRFGNLNSTQVEGPKGMIRLPGSGGACDIASLAQRFVVLLEHKKERLPERVSFLTSPGYGDGGDWRKRVGLPRGGPSAAITTKAVLRFDAGK